MAARRERFEAARGAWRRLSPRARQVAVAGIVLLAALLAWSFWPEGNQRSGRQNAAATAVATGTVEEFVTAQGKLGPKDYVDVGTQVSGQLQKLHVALGDEVRAGDLLAEIDPTIYQTKVQADQAQLANLRAQLADRQATLLLARANHARNLLLVSSTAISRQEADTSAAALKSAEAGVASLRAQIRQAQSSLESDQANMGYTKIYAPISGTVVVQTTREGQTVNASQSAPTIVQVANLDVMTVTAQVAEADVMRVKAGMPVHFTTLGALDKPWRGTVRQVLPSPEVVNDVVLYDVLIDADNTERQLMTGMSTQVFFEIGRAENVPVIPVGALGKLVSGDASGTQVYKVRVKQGNQYRMVDVGIGLMDRTQAEVRSGLKLGDMVVGGAAAVSASAGGQRSGGGRGFGGGPRL